MLNQEKNFSKKQNHTKKHQQSNVNHEVNDLIFEQVLHSQNGDWGLVIGEWGKGSK
ncbi:MAG: hypothetical protein N2235_21890 [Fischerella sp.]|nr:hypothetical protein [Fischerella sp.]